MRVKKLDLSCTSRSDWSDRSFARKTTVEFQGFAVCGFVNPTHLALAPVYPARILLWAVAFKFEVMTFEMLFVVGSICAGLFMASWGQTDFSLTGLLMILGASCLSGLR